MVIELEKVFGSSAGRPLVTYMIRDLRRLEFIFDARSKPMQINRFDGWDDGAVKQAEGEPCAPATCPLVQCHTEIEMHEISSTKQLLKCDASVMLVIEI